jgi:hypothetical protein
MSIFRKDAHLLFLFAALLLILPILALRLVILVGYNKLALSNLWLRGRCSSPFLPSTCTRIIAQH